MTRTLAPRFPPQTLTFLRALKRNNRREWFLAHRDEYERHVRQPMLDMIERLAEDLRGFAPDVVVLLHRPDAFERDDPRGGEADLILAKHRNGPTKTVTVAHQLHLSRFANMAR